MRALVLLAILSALGCSDAGSPGALEVAGLDGSRPGLEAAGRAAEAFLTAVRDADEEAVAALLTEKGRALLGTEDGFSFEGQDTDEFTLGEPRADGDGARVPATVVVDGEEQQFDLQLRVEDRGWHVIGIELQLGGMPFAVSFEGEETVADALMDGLAAEMNQAFEEAAANWQSGGSAEEIATARARYDALSEIEGDLDAAWQLELSAGEYTCDALIERSLEGSGFELAADGFGAELGRPLTLGQRTTSRIQLLEETCVELGLVPHFEDADPWGQTPARVTLTQGTRTTPVAFAGPFMLELSLDEEAPNTRGTLTIAARALGLADPLLAANTEMGEFITVGAVAASTGASLLAEEDVQYWGTPTTSGNALGFQVSVSLRGLLRDVETLGVEGTVRLSWPEELAELHFEQPGRQAGGTFWVTCKSLGESSQFEIGASSEHPREVFERVAVRFAPDDASGEPLGVLSSSSYAWGESAIADLATPSQPARIGLKVFLESRSAWGFRLTGVPLSHFAEQPLELTVLEYEGDAPLRAEFQRFEEVASDAFPEVRLALVSSANKAILGASATFEYLDAAGETLEEFPHQLTGPYDFDGAQPLVGARGSVELTTTAFFMPEGTARVRVRVDQIEFVDGSTWTRD